MKRKKQKFQKDIIEDIENKIQKLMGELNINYMKKLKKQERI